MLLPRVASLEFDVQGAAAAARESSNRGSGGSEAINSLHGKGRAGSVAGTRPPVSPPLTERSNTQPRPGLSLPGSGLPAMLRTPPKLRSPISASPVRSVRSLRPSRKSSDPVERKATFSIYRRAPASLPTDAHQFPEPDSKVHEDPNKMGMFSGVIVPTCANMWGVLIFLRFNNIVGNAGLGLSLVIATLSFMVALLTTLSLSAIATCGTSHKSKGVFQLLARALGREIATAIGVLYFLGIVLGAVLESLGACEVFMNLSEDLRGFTWDVQLWGSVFMVSLAALVLGGMSLVSRLGLVFFGVTLVTLFFFYVSLFSAPNLRAVDAEEIAGSSIGLSGRNFVSNFGPSYKEGQSFSSMLALFFPCFTGFLSGANRASSLRNPVRGIPLGTLAGISISYVLYVSYMLLWAAVGDRAFLQLERGQLGAFIWPSVLAVRIGIVVTSLGQALQNLVVAPILLQSIAKEGVIKKLNVFAKQHNSEPKRALVFAYLVGGLCVLIGSLDLVAPLLSMCFLLCYSSMNLNCFVLDWLQDPSWRPRWKYYHWSVGLAGFLLCVAIMFAINYIYALVAWAFAGAIVAYIMRSNAETDWGSALHGLRFKLAMRSLMAIDMKAHLAVAWMPQILMVYQLQEEEDDKTRVGEDADSAVGHTHFVMLSLAEQLRKGQGLVIAAAVIPLQENETMNDPNIVAYAESEKRFMSYLYKRLGLQGFPMTVMARNPIDAKAYAIQCAGLGPLAPNTVLMGWPWWWRREAETHVPAFVESIHQCSASQKAVLLGVNLRNFPTSESLPLTGCIDVWWIKHDGGLLLLLSNLLKKHRIWRRCDIRLHLITDKRTNPNVIKNRMHHLLSIVNITATVEEVILVNSESVLPYMNSSDTRKKNEMSVARGADAKTVDELICEDPALLMPEDADDFLRGSMKGMMTKRRVSNAGRLSSAVPAFGLAGRLEEELDLERADVLGASAPRPSIFARRDSQARSSRAPYSSPGALRSRQQSLANAEPPPRVSVRDQDDGEAPSSPPPSPPRPTSRAVDLADVDPTVSGSSSASQPGIPGHLERDLTNFISRSGIAQPAAEELRSIFERVAASASPAGDAAPSQHMYEWKEMNTLIREKSSNSQLVIVNLPDPPEVARSTADCSWSAGDMEDMQNYMEYMEGLTIGLKRVLFVHGSGQEIISFDAL